MQKSKSLRVAAAVMIGILFLGSSCKKSSSGLSGENTGKATVSFTVDGDGMVNQSIIIDGIAGSAGNESIYSTKWNFTHGVITDDKSRFSFYTNGKQTGQQKLGTDLAIQAVHLPMCLSYWRCCERTGPRKHIFTKIKHMLEIRSRRAAAST